MHLDFIFHIYVKLQTQAKPGSLLYFHPITRTTLAQEFHAQMPGALMCTAQLQSTQKLIYE